MALFITGDDCLVRSRFLHAKIRFVVSRTWGVHDYLLFGGGAENGALLMLLYER